ncbi:MAG: hypothetical protein ACRDOT_04055 [Aeromicrobium sp.]
MRDGALTVDRKVAAALVAALLAVAPAACKQAEAVEQEHYQASKITPAEHGDHATVTITKLAAERIGLETVPIESNQIPYAAILYDAKGGQPYVFVNTKGLSFHREDVEIASIEGDTVKLADGPPAGTKVVTVGVPQIHGAELEFGAY